MPVHDWTRVSAGTFHDFHNGWITHLKEALNGGILPAGFYAQSEQHAGDVGDSETVRYSTLRRTLVIRHASGHRLVALVEILSPVTKATRDKLDAFLAKAEEGLAHGYHLLLVDLFAPGQVWSSRRSGCNGDWP